jgi:hypothetical protein
MVFDELIVPQSYKPQRKETARVHFYRLGCRLKVENDQYPLRAIRRGTHKGIVLVVGPSGQLAAMPQRTQCWMEPPGFQDPGLLGIWRSCPAAVGENVPDGGHSRPVRVPLTNFWCETLAAPSVRPGSQQARGRVKRKIVSRAAVSRLASSLFVFNEIHFYGIAVGDNFYSMNPLFQDLRLPQQRLEFIVAGARYIFCDENSIYQNVRSDHVI